MVASRKRLLGYGMALLAVGVAALVRYHLKSALGEGAPLMLFGLAAALSASYGGLGPGLFATGLGALVGMVYFIEPVGSLAIAQPSDGMRVAVFVVVGCVLSALAQVTHSARAHAEASAERLRASENRTARIVRTASEGIWTSDSEGRVTYVNDRMAEMLGACAREIIGRPVADFIFPEDEPAYRQRRERRRRGVAERFDLQYRRVDGSALPAFVSTTPLTTEGGEYEGTLAMVTDITERKQAEETLRAREERFRGLVENTSDGITLLDASGKILYDSPAVQRLLGCGLEERLGKSGDEWVHPDDALPAAEFFGALGRKPGASAMCELRLRVKDGSSRLFELKGSNLLHVPGVSGIVLNWRDLTTERTLEHQLHQAQKMEAVGRLAGGVAHDFNNMLAVITGYTDLGLVQLAPDDPLRPWLVEVLNAANRATSLTRQLLTFSKKQVVEPRTVDISTVVSDTEGMLQRLIGEDIEFVTRLERELGLVRADVGQLEQVLLNLVVNARDAMSQGGKLTVETQNVELDESDTRHHQGVEPGHYVLLTVSDTGSGMAPEIQSRIFEPFFTTKPQGRGTGLGLATVYGIVKQSGGCIDVSSELGHGSTFKVYLPRTEALTEERSPSSVAKDTAGGAETLLLVEDEESVRGAVQTMLLARGYRVLTAGGPDEAHAICRTHPGQIHLLVTDVVMPLMGGPELAERLVAERPDMGVLFMSGYTDDAVVRHGVLAAEVAFIQKPFTPQALAAKVRAVLRNRQPELVGSGAA